MGREIVASIEYGIDGDGKKVYANEAVGGRTYRCPYCFDNIHVRRCHTMDDYFAHEAITNRTPQQVICPGYTGLGKNENTEEDHLYIVNGGVPLRLIERTKQNFELVAFFPPLNQESMDLLTKWNTKVEIEDNGLKEVYSASNLRRYSVRSATKWIKIKCTNMCGKISEVHKKWEWGIRGIDFDNDFFISDFSGGSRVSQHSNIVLGKEYLIISKYTNIHYIRGVKVEERGKLILSNMLFKREYDVFSVVIVEATDEAIAFVHSKGYQLIERNDEIIPLWPPAIIEGKELIFKKTDSEAILYHEKRSKQEVYLWDKRFPIHVSEKNSLIKIRTNSNLIIVSDYIFNSFSKEIRFFLTQDRDNYDIIKTFESNMRWKFKTGTEEIIGDNIPEKLFCESARIVGDSRVTAITTWKGYVLRSSSSKIEKLKKDQKLYIDNQPFNNIVLGEEIDQEEGLRKNNTAIINEYVNMLYKCQPDYIASESLINRWLIKGQGLSDELCKILLYWRYMGKMPFMAEKILMELEEVLND